MKMFQIIIKLSLFYNKKLNKLTYNSRVLVYIVKSSFSSTVGWDFMLVHKFKSFTPQDSCFQLSENPPIFSLDPDKIYWDKNFFNYKRI